jgi:hypothetical protein
MPGFMLSPIVFRAGPDGVPRMGGETRCPRPCSECSDNPGTHHFSDAMIGTAVEEPSHEAAFDGDAMWFTCKHCNGWLEYTNDSDELLLYHWQPSLGTVERSDKLDVWERIGEAQSIEQAHNVATKDATDESGSW